MVGIYGQTIPANGWTLDAFEVSYGDDDPEDHMTYFPAGLFDISTDPDWLNEPIYGVNMIVPGTDEFVSIPGQLSGIRRDILYGE